MKSIPTPHRPIRRILCIRTDRLGEFLLTLPAMQLLKSSYPSAEITLLAQKQNLDLIRGASWLSGEIPVEMLPKSSWKISRILRQKAFDMAIVFNPKKEFHQAVFLAGIPLRVGYRKKNGFLLNRNRLHTQKQDNEHEVDMNIRLISLICPQAPAPSPELPWNKKEAITEFLRTERLQDKAPFIVIHPFTSDASKALPFSFWDKLIQEWTSAGQNILIIGQASEYHGSEFSKIRNPRVFNAAGKLSLSQLGILLKHHCRFYAGLDSGPYHMASLLGLPLAVIFRKPDMVPLWGPYFGKENAKVVFFTEDQSEAAQQEVLRAFGRTSAA